MDRKNALIFFMTADGVMSPAKIGNVPWRGFFPTVENRCRSEILYSFMHSHAKWWYYLLTVSHSIFTISRVSVFLGIFESTTCVLRYIRITQITVAKCRQSRRQIPAVRWKKFEFPARKCWCSDGISARPWRNSVTRAGHGAAVVNHTRLHTITYSYTVAWNYWVVVHSREKCEA